MTDHDEVKCRQGVRIALVPVVVPTVMGGRPLIKDAGSREVEARDNLIGDMGSTRTHSHGNIRVCVLIRLTPMSITRLRGSSARPILIGPCMLIRLAPKSALRDRAALMLVAIIAVVVLPLTTHELPAFPSRLTIKAGETSTVARSITRDAQRPWIRRIFAVTEDPFRWRTSSNPAMVAPMRVHVPRRRWRTLTFGATVFGE